MLFQKCSLAIIIVAAVALMLQPSHAIRFPLSGGGGDEGGGLHTPYLYSTSTFSKTSEPIRWNQQSWLDIIHSSEIVEISSRGIRSILKERITSTTNWWWVPARLRLTPLSSDFCNAKYEVLCWMGIEGGLFPSTTMSVNVTGLLNPNFTSGVLSTYAKRSKDSCGDNAGAGWGKGRDIISNMSVYVVSSCDVLNGHLVVMFEPAHHRVILFSQTFGPMAYFVVISCSLLCLYGASGEVFRKFPTTQVPLILTSVFSMSSILACSLLAVVHGIPFVTIGDETNFWAAVIMGIWFAVVGILNCDKSQVEDSCIFALVTLTVAMYRTPENPYAGILISITSIKLWKKMFKVCRASNNINVKLTYSSAYGQIDLVVTTLHLCLLVEVGLVPQFAEPEDWPVYAGIGLYVSFIVAWYQEITSLPL
jgi:hypothetical protein